MTIAPRWGGVSHGRLYESPKKITRAVSLHLEHECELLRNISETCAPDWHKSDTGLGSAVPDLFDENAAQAGGLDGAKDTEGAAKHPLQCNTEWASTATVSARSHARDLHGSAAYKRRIS